MNPQIASFDIFDTVLTRRAGSPQKLFLLLGVRLRGQGKLNCSPQAFAQARVDAECRVGKNSPGREVTLRAIHAELASALQLAESDSDWLMDAEMALEAELLCPVPGIEAILANARQTQRIRFVSDMYLPGSFLASQLRRFDLWKDGDVLYVSCDAGCSKEGGRLYRHVARQEGVPANGITHHGNDAHLDGFEAKRAGLKIEPAQRANLTRYEGMLDSYAAVTDGMSSFFAGAARLARLQVPAESEREEALRDVAADVAGPTLCAYVLWVLNSAVRMKLDRLYFISRDGEILLPLARKIAKWMGYDIELNYLFGSRQAWHLPALNGLDSGLDWIADRDLFLSVRSMLRRIGLEPQELETELKSIGLDSGQWDCDLKKNEISSIVDQLRRPRVQWIIQERGSSRLETVISYLSQEGVLDNVRWGYVDVGWHGRMQRSLATMVRKGGGNLPAGFYFGLVERQQDAGPMLAYMADWAQGAGLLDCLRGPHMLIEVFCAGTTGLLLDYRRREGSDVVPVFKTSANSAVIDWGIEIVQRTVWNFADHLSLEHDLLNARADLRGAIFDLLRTFWSSPTPSWAGAWGSFPSEDDQTGSFSVRFARPLKWADMFMRIAPRYVTLAAHPFRWQSGSLAQSSRAKQFGWSVAQRIASARMLVSRRLRSAGGA